MADLSPIMSLFREWERKYRQASDLSLDEEVAEAALDQCGTLGQRIEGLKPGSMQDFAAKMVVTTAYGMFTPGDVGEGGLLDEALAILARERPDVQQNEPRASMGKPLQVTAMDARSNSGSD